MSKTMKFTEFYDRTVSILSNDYAVAGDMGLTSNTAVKIVSLSVNLQHNDGTKNETIGKYLIQSSHWACCELNQPLIANGDILLDGTTYYEIVYFNFVSSFMGSYFEMGLNRIDE